jgi:hypothetical protein
LCSFSSMCSTIARVTASTGRLAAVLRSGS